MQEAAPKKIAVLGGGLAAMTAVFHLLQDPDWEKKYAITVYQMGWRIGGKGASGVNPEQGYRIEEHGLHLWMGFYENAFWMMRNVYQALGRSAGAPLANFDAAFKGQGYMVFAENIKGEWLDWNIGFPRLEGKVGDGHCGNFALLLDSIFHDLFGKIKEWMEEKKSLPPDPELAAPVKEFLPAFLHDWVDEITADLKTGFEHISHEFFYIVCELLKRFTDFEEKDHPYILEAIDRFRNWMRKELDKYMEHHQTARRVYITVDLMTTIFRGMIRDHMIHKTDGKIWIDFDAINGDDYAHWFAKHGADPELTVSSVFIRSMYDGPFAFLKGNKQQPNIEAGTMLRNFLRLGFTCKENVVWRMQAGMGDTIFAPVYEVLRKKYNVQFKFFHRVEELIPSADGQQIAAVRIAQQVRLTRDQYDPLLEINGLKCWPSHPLYDQLLPEDADALKRDNINLESSWTPWKDTGSPVTLEVGKDFDEVILGASLGSMPELCASLIQQKQPWANMVDKVKTVQTQAWQLWFNQSPEQLKVEPGKLLSTYIEPVDTFAEMNQLLVRENWPASAKTQYIAYLCGVLEDAPVIPPYSDHGFPKQEWTRVRDQLASFIQNGFQHLLPGSFGDDGFRWDTLVDLSNQTGAERINQQYLRANIDPSERYVLSVVDSSRHRIRTDDTGYSNLFITGDWIQNHFNAGFVECAVTAGILTARAVSGNKAIPIFTPEWDPIKI